MFHPRRRERFSRGVPQDLATKVVVKPDALLAARGITDAEDRLLSADQPLAELQQRCGGQVPGMLAIPELLELVRQGRQTGLRIAREFSAIDGDGRVSGFVRVQPAAETSGCEILIENWRREALKREDDREIAARQDAIDRATAEYFARLDGKQRLLAGEGSAADLAELLKDTRKNAGKMWTEYVTLVGVNHRQPLHWRLLDGANCKVAGSSRDWRARLIPVGSEPIAPRGFELLLVADQPLATLGGENDHEQGSQFSIIGETLTPALSQPVARIIANADKIHSRLAGPLRQEYVDYAEDIVGAGKHLSSLLDDLDDLETVESHDFKPSCRPIDLAELARQAVSMLGQRAEARRIKLIAPDHAESLPALGEGKRVLQILLNLIGNSINYSPEHSEVRVLIGEASDALMSITIADQGPGLTRDQQERVFTKFERLGRSGDGGSGLGLYISRRLAEAMGGQLDVTSEPGRGAQFTLSLPRNP